MKALITGGAGFVGRHLRRRLYILGWDVQSFDVRPFSIDKHHDRETGWRQDARDFFRNSDDRYDLVIHAAAVVGGREKIEGAPIDLAVDLSLDAELFQWALRTRPKHVVYLSSSAVYPIHLQTGQPPRRLHERIVNLADDVVGMPDQTYGWTKLSGELLARYARAEGLKVHVVRPFSGYGADQDQTYPFPALLRRVLAGNDFIDVWGDGTQVRDWVHIDDVVGTIMTMVEENVPGPLNVGWGDPYSFIELIHAMAKFADRSIKGIVPRVDKPVGVQYRVCDPSNLFMLRPPKITLEEGIIRALARA